MLLHHRTSTIQRALVQSAATHSRTLARPWSHSHHNSPLKNRYSLFSTSGSSSAINTTPSSPGDTNPRSQQNSGRFTGWVRRITLMSASAATGALVYSKMDPASIEGLKGMPLGMIQPTLLEAEEPDQPFLSNGKVNPENLEEIKQVFLLEKQMHELDLVYEYKDKVKQGEWNEADPYWYLTKATEPHHLTAGTLRGENMLSVHPLKFQRKDRKAVVLFMHLGRSLCGHDRIIHGGLLATVLDEATGMVALPNLPFHVGFTANLNINYRKPVKADQFVMVKAEFKKGEGRKGYTTATIHDIHGNILVECTALYVSPKNPVVMVANYVKNSLGI